MKQCTNQVQTVYRGKFYIYTKVPSFKHESMNAFAMCLVTVRQSTTSRSPRSTARLSAFCHLPLPAFTLAITSYLSPVVSTSVLFESSPSPNDEPPCHAQQVVPTGPVDDVPIECKDGPTTYMRRSVSTVANHTMPRTYART